MTRPETHDGISPDWHGVDLDLVTDGWWELDFSRPDYEYFSDRFWHTLGYDPEKMPRTPEAWKSIIHPEDKARAIEALAPHIEEGRPYNLLVRYRHAKGHWVWIVCRGQAVFEDGKPASMVGAHQDVTSLVQGQMSLSPKLSESGRGMLENMERLLGILDSRDSV